MIIEFVIIKRRLSYSLCAYINPLLFHLYMYQIKIHARCALCNGHYILYKVASESLDDESKECWKVCINESNRTKSNVGGCIARYKMITDGHIQRRN